MQARKKRHIGKRLLGLVCTAALLLETAPLSIAAQDAPPSALPAQAEEGGGAQIIGEVEERRDAHTKVFRMSDGRYMAAMYNEPVHYQDDAGDWQDINNTLQQSAAARSADDGEWETTAGPVKIKLSNKLKAGKTVTYKTGDYTLTWGLEGAEKVRGTADAPGETAQGDERWLTLEHTKSRVIYPDPYPDVDVEYVLTPSQVKENLILKACTAQSTFVTSYTIKGMTAVQMDERTIALYDGSDTGRKDPLCILSAPVMTDAAGACSDRLTLTIVEQTKKTLRVELHADEAWLQEESRVYPVVLDPVLVSTQSVDKIEDTFVCTNDDKYPDLGTYGSVVVGRDTYAYGQCRALVNFRDLPEMKNGDMVVAAQLNLVQMPNSMSPAGTEMQIDVHAVTKEWHISGSNKATWSRMANAYDPTILDYVITTGHSEAQWDSWDVSKTVKEWYEGTRPQYGFMLKRHVDDESVLAARTVFIASDNYPLTGTFPCLQIYFLNNTGLEDYWSFSSQETTARCCYSSAGSSRPTRW